MRASKRQQLAREWRCDRASNRQGRRFEQTNSRASSRRASDGRATGEQVVEQAAVQQTGERVADIKNTTINQMAGLQTGEQRASEWSHGRGERVSKLAAEQQSDGRASIRASDERASGRANGQTPSEKNTTINQMAGLQMGERRVRVHSRPGLR